MPATVSIAVRVLYSIGDDAAAFEAITVARQVEEGKGGEKGKKRKRSKWRKPDRYALDLFDTYAAMADPIERR